jgi:hypothetical protein
VTGTWLGEQVFEEAHRQIIRPEPVSVSADRMVPLAAPGPGPRPRFDPGQPILRQGNAHGMPVRPARVHVNEVAQNNLPARPNEGYQARVAPIIARLRAEGVEFNDAPRQFNIARDLARNIRAGSRLARPLVNEGAQNDSPSMPNDNYQARVAPILARLRAEGVEFNDAPRQFNFPRDLARNLRAASPPSAPDRRRPTVAPTTRFVSDGRTVWVAATGSEPAVDTSTDLETDSDV